MVPVVLIKAGTLRHKVPMSERVIDEHAPWACEPVLTLTGRLRVRLGLSIEPRDDQGQEGTTVVKNDAC